MDKKKKPKQIKEAEELMETYAKDLEVMAKSAYDQKECGDCLKCDEATKCIRGLRNGIGDLAETMEWLIREMRKLDSSVYDIVSMAPKPSSEPDYFQ